MNPASRCPCPWSSAASAAAARPGSDAARRLRPRPRPWKAMQPGQYDVIHRIILVIDVIGVYICVIESCSILLDVMMWLRCDLEFFRSPCRWNFFSRLWPEYKCFQPAEVWWRCCWSLYRCHGMFRWRKLDKTSFASWIQDELAWDFVPAAFAFRSNATPHECTGGWGAIFACHSPQKPPSGSIFSSPFGSVQTSARHPEKDWQACYQRSPCQTGFLEIGLPRSTRARKTTGRVRGRRRILNWIPWCQEDTFRL